MSETTNTLVISNVPEKVVVTTQRVQLVEVSRQGPEGAQGAKGDKGDKGDQGPVGIDLTYEFIQAQPSDSWQITHTLNKIPSVTVVDSAGSVVEGAVEYPGLNQVVVTFAAAFSGKAYLN